MGVVTRQTLKNSTVMLVGVIVGTLSTLFVYPLNEETLEFYGKLQFIISAAAILAPFCNLGIGNLSVRFFPEFAENREDHRGFLGLLFLLLAVAVITFLSFSYLFRYQGLFLLEQILPNAQDFWTNAREVLTLTLITVFIAVMTRYLTNFQRVVVPSVLSNLLQKVTTVALVLMCYFSVLHDGYLKWLYIGSKLLVAMLLLAYIYRLGALHLKIDWSFLSRDRIKNMAGYASFGVLGSLGGVIAFRIDTVMIAGMLDWEATGIYSIALFIANIMIIPNKSVGPLLGAQIAEQSHLGNLAKIKDLYKRSAQSLLILGLGFFLLVWWNLEGILSYTPNPDKLMEGQMVVLYLGFAKLFDMVTGLNSHVINYSRYYRWNLVFIILFGAITIMANLYLIPKFQITGAAMATLVSLTTFNLLKQVFLWVKFRMQPFSTDTLVILGLGILTSVIIYLFPQVDYTLVDIAIRSVIICLVFGLPIYMLNLSPEVNKVVNKGLKLAGLGHWVRD